MAVDEALLQCMSAGDDPVLRLYGFAPPCVSLGRFQSAGDLGDDGMRQRDGVGLVRRPTGGRAVLHDDEVTYAVVLGHHHLEPFGKRAAYRASAAILLRLLPALGIRGAVQPGAAGTAPREPDPDCFRSTAEYEITAGRKKLVGSAQTTTRNAALQHGSIPLSAAYTGIARYLRPRPVARPGQLAAATSVAQETASYRSHEEALQLLATAAAAQLQVRRSQLSAAEARLARELEATRYACPRWTWSR